MSSHIWTCNYCDYEMEFNVIEKLLHKTSKFVFSPNKYYQQIQEINIAFLRLPTTPKILRKEI